MNAALSRAAGKGVSWFRPRIAGLGHASDLMLTGRTIDAAEAERMGVVSQVVPEHELLKTAYTLADALIANNAVGIALTKRALRTNVDAPGADALDLHSLNQP